MSRVAITAEGLGKRYRLGQIDTYRTLRDEIAKVSQRLLNVGNKTPMSDLRREFWALKDASFEIKSGEVVGLIGPNGAGKSTLLKLIARITTPTTGRAEVFGRVGTLLEVGTGFHPELSGRENIFLNASVLGIPRQEVVKRFDEIVDFSGVEEFLDTPVKRFSSGMRVRLAFAVSSILDPEIMIVDEVLSVGDAQFRERSEQKMKSVAGDGRTVVFVSHNLAAIQNITERCILLDEGRIIDDGPTSEIVSKYLKSVLPQKEQAEAMNADVPGVIVNSIKLGGDENELGYGKDLSFEVSFSTDRQISDLFLGIQIINSRGSRVMTLGAPIKEIPKGDSVVRVRHSPCYLSVGQFSVNFGMAIHGQGVLYREGVMNFEIPADGVKDWFMGSRQDVLGVYPPVLVDVDISRSSTS